MSKYKDNEYLEIYDKIYNSKILGTNTLEEKIEELRNRKVGYRYMVKTIKSGDMLESEIYPIYLNYKDRAKRGANTEKTNKEQNNLNDKNAIKKFIRIVNTNFTKDDLLITLTYKDKYLPTQKQAKKDVTNYIRRLRRYLRKHNLPELKYVYVIEYVDEEEQHKSKKIRVHHHIIINKMDREKAEDIWKKGRVEARRLQPDDFGLEGIARYMLKDPRKKHWYGSRNLKSPTIFTSKSRLTNRKAEELVKDSDKGRLFEKMYREKYDFKDCETYYSDFTGGFYLYAKMKRRE